MIAQILIAVLGVTAVWLSQDALESRKRYACLFGLAGQPAWFYAAWTTQQWGIFALCFLYSFCWLRGLRQYWLTGPRPDVAVGAQADWHGADGRCLPEV